MHIGGIQNDTPSKLNLFGDKMKCNLCNTKLIRTHLVEITEPMFVCDECYNELKEKVDELMEMDSEVKELMEGKG